KGPGFAGVSFVVAWTPTRNLSLQQKQTEPPESQVPLQRRIPYSPLQRETPKEKYKITPKIIQKPQHLAEYHL
ncbi:MAG: hypothetical protein KAR21_24125, partial [Spirochaetales bacterium]|nr:hypothetical protein [Spirochaetales bacterium]